MLEFTLDYWSALAPGLQTPQAWREWIEREMPLQGEPVADLGQVPAMLRRRLSPLGKCAFSAALLAAPEDESIPTVFVSRHGETAQTLALLEQLVAGEPMSPTGFSLSVHNAISGLFSIARKDTSPVTTLAATEAPLLQGVFEAVAQLQQHERVLCVVYEAPLPELYRHYTTGEPCSYALALQLSRAGGSNGYRLYRQDSEDSTLGADHPQWLETVALIGLLLGLSTTWSCRANGLDWVLEKLP